MWGSRLIHMYDAGAASQLDNVMVYLDRYTEFVIVNVYVDVLDLTAFEWEAN